MSKKAKEQSSEVSLEELVKRILFETEGFEVERIANGLILNVSGEQYYGQTLHDAISSWFVGGKIEELPI